MNPRPPSHSRSPTHSPAPGGRRLPCLARAAVEAALNLDGTPPPAGPAADPFLAERHAVFVTLHDQDGQLRGCVGTLTPKFPNVAEETRAMAREAAFHDSRFPPVRPAELTGLQFEVSVLHPLEAVDGAEDLDPAVYGVVVTAADGRRGALLPGLDGVDTPAQQLAITRKKARIGPSEPIRLQRFRVDHFEESTD